jgi:hypothetical protein
LLIGKIATLLLQTGIVTSSRLLERLDEDGGNGYRLW